MKTAIITGGSRGIGEAMTLKLGEMGYNVVINYRSESSKALTEKLIETLKEKYGVEGYAVRADVSKYEDCETLVKAAVEKFGEKIDVLVNNAGITNNSPFCELSRESYMAVLETQRVPYVPFRRSLHGKGERGLRYQHILNRRTYGCCESG